MAATSEVTKLEMAANALVEACKRLDEAGERVESAAKRLNAAAQRAGETQTMPFVFWALDHRRRLTVRGRACWCERVVLGFPRRSHRRSRRTRRSCEEADHARGDRVMGAYQTDPDLTPFEQLHEYSLWLEREWLPGIIRTVQGEPEPEPHRHLRLVTDDDAA